MKKTTQGHNSSNRTESRTHREKNHSENMPSVSHFDSKSIQVLEKKFEEERNIWKRENDDLMAKLMKEISQGNERKLSFQKSQQRYQSEIRRLETDNETLYNKLQLRQQQQQDPDSILEEEQAEKQVHYLKTHKQLVLKYKQLESEFNELQETLLLVNRQNDQLRAQNDHILQETNRLTRQIELFQQNKSRDEMELNKVKNLMKEYVAEKEQINREFQKYNERIEELQEELLSSKSKLTESKAKKKETEKHLKEIELKMEDFQKIEKQKFEEQLEQQRKELQNERQKNTQLVTKLSFSEIAVQKKDCFIKELEATISELNEKRQEIDLKCAALQKQMSLNDAQVSSLRDQMKAKEKAHEESLQEAKQNAEAEVRKIKKKVIEEIYPILKDKNEERSKKNFENYLRTTKSSSQFNKLPLILNENLAYENNRQAVNSAQNGGPFDRLKLQTQINSLQMQLLNLQKSMDCAHDQNSKLKASESDLKVKVDSKARENQELRLKIDKIESNKSTEVQNMRKEISHLKQKETEALEIMRDRSDYEEAMGLKIGFYDKKIKELLENIERKDTIIEKLKHNRADLQDRVKFYEEKIEKILDENEALRRSKQDLTRKDELLKDYKAKLQKLRAEGEESKASIESLKKEKARLQNSLESKEEYLSSLKKKHSKEILEVQKLSEQKGRAAEVKHLKNNKEQFQNKTKKLKKEIDSLHTILEEIKESVFQKVERALLLLNSKKKKGKNTRRYVVSSSLSLEGEKLTENASEREPLEYEGAQMLGLNDSQLEGFLNPTKENPVDRKVVNVLENLWENENYSEFICQAIDFFQNQISQALQQNFISGLESTV